MAWREALAKEGIGESTVESSVTIVRSSTSWIVSLIAILVIGGGEGVATFKVLLRGVSVALISGCQCLSLDSTRLVLVNMMINSSTPTLYVDTEYQLIRQY